MMCFTIAGPSGASLYYLVGQSGLEPLMQLPSDPLAGHERYQTTAYLDRGAAGFVLQAVNKRTGEHVAIKLLKRALCSKYVVSEIFNHSMLRHPQIIALKDLFSTPEYICIVMELAKLGNLFNYVVERKQLPESVARFMFQQLMLAVDHCHQRGVVNRDLKLENTLLHPMPGDWPLPLLKLCDFGFSKADHQSAPKSVVGTLRYMAPEVLLNADRSRYDGKPVDVWSCGVMLYAMLYGKFPYDTINTSAAEGQRVLENMLKMRLPLEGVEVSQGCRDLLREMLQPDPRRRATVERILAHPWFRVGLPANVIADNAEYLRQAINLDKSKVWEQKIAAVTGYALFRANSR